MYQITGQATSKRRGVRVGVLSTSHNESMIHCRKEIIHDPTQDSGLDFIKDSKFKIFLPVML